MERSQAPELLQQILDFTDTWEHDNQMPWAITRDAEGQIKVFAIAGGGWLVHTTLAGAVLDGAVEVALAFEAFGVDQSDPEVHAERVLKYGPSFARWPSDLVRECISIHYDAKDGPDHHAHRDLTNGEVGEIVWEEGEVGGRLGRWFNG